MKITKNNISENRVETVDYEVAPAIERKAKNLKDHEFVVAHGTGYYVLETYRDGELVAKEPMPIHGGIRSFIEGAVEAAYKNRKKVE